MQIRINLQIFLFIIVFIITHQIEIYGWIMLFGFIHEIGHMIAGLLLKLKPKSLSFMPFGISVTFETYEFRKLVEKKKVLIAIAGPLTNILICLIVHFLQIDIRIKALIEYSNILIAIFNLIPIYPLDGGRILKGLLRIKYNEIESEKLINRISNILTIILTAISSIMILYLKNIAILLVITYIWTIVINENKRFSLKLRAYKVVEKTKECIDI